MRTRQMQWKTDSGWSVPEGGLIDPTLVFVFGSRQVLADSPGLASLRELYPDVPFLGCSTAGEIYATGVHDDSLVATAVQLEHSRIETRHVLQADPKQSRSAGRELARAFDAEGLVHVFVLSDGLRVNGSELVRGMTETLPDSVTVTGGLAGDGAGFQHTTVLHDDVPTEGCIRAVGFYGERLKVGFASLGGWDTFGPARTVTRSEGNVLFELDGRSALELYKHYLGEHAQGLPATGLLFPLAVKTPDGEEPVVRTILSVDEATQSMTFAGDVPVGSSAQLMRANFDRLVEGAAGAARGSLQPLGADRTQLALLISCVGRKMVLRQRIEEEVEAVRDILGTQATLTGFYSYGEISPFRSGAPCALHNQTMTVTTFCEV